MPGPKCDKILRRMVGQKSVTFCYKFLLTVLALFYIEKYWQKNIMGYKILNFENKMHVLSITQSMTLLSKKCIIQGYLYFFYNCTFKKLLYFVIWVKGVSINLSCHSLSNDHNYLSKVLWMFVVCIILKMFGELLCSFFCFKD